MWVCFWMCCHFTMFLQCWQFHQLIKPWMVLKVCHPSRPTCRGYNFRFVSFYHTSCFNMAGKRKRGKQGTEWEVFDLWNWWADAKHARSSGLWRICFAPRSGKGKSKGKDEAEDSVGWTTSNLVIKNIKKPRENTQISNQKRTWQKTFLGWRQEEKTVCFASSTLGWQGEDSEARWGENGTTLLGFDSSFGIWKKLESQSKQASKSKNIFWRRGLSRETQSLLEAKRQREESLHMSKRGVQGSGKTYQDSWGVIVAGW